MAGNFERMKAARLFAAELRTTAIEVPKKGADQYESQLYLTQTGLKAARVMVVGTATEIDDIGSDSSFYRMRVSDPTGVFFVTAGQYQPDAAKIMQELTDKLPAFVAVVGKISLFTTNENAVLTSIRAEQIAVVDENVRDTWLLDTAKATLDRLSALKSNPTLGQEVDTAYPEKDDYKKIIKTILQSMKSDVGAVPPAPPAPSVPATQAPSATPQSAKAASPTEPTEDDLKNFVEQKIVAMNKGNGVGIAHLAQPCKGAGITAIKMESIISALMQEGRVYEPKTGVLMPAGV